MYTNGTTTISGKKIVVDGRVILNPTAEEIAQQQREARIWELKDQLAQGDYKIIKCAEAQLTNEPMPYDVATLVAERNAMRAEINELEGQNTLEA